MASQLQHLRSSTENKRPTASGLIDGRIAINTASGSPGLFFKDNAGTVIKVGPVHVGSGAPNANPASGGSSGNSIGEQWLDNSGGNYVFKIWDGSAWRSETGEFVNASGDTMTGDLVMNDANIVFEGSTEDGFETTLTVVDPTADRTITLPNVTGTVVTTGDSGTVTSTMIADGTIVNADINSSAAIALSKIATGALPSGITVASANIVDGTIVNADVNASAAIAGTKIDPDFGSQAVETTGVINAGSGTEAAPAVTVGTTDNGLYSPGTDQVALATNGTGRLFVNASGNVGVGTANPTAKFALATSAGTDCALTLNEGTTISPLTIEQTATESRIQTEASQPLVVAGQDGLGSTSFLAFETRGTERLRIASDGKVGVGTSSPVATLDVGGSTATSNGGLSNVNFYAGFTPTGGGNTFGGVLAGSGVNGNTPFIAASRNGAGTGLPLTFFTDGTERIRISSTGNVGIGTTSPGVALHVDGDIRCDGVYGETDTNTSIQFPGSDVITFNEGGSEAARIDSSGRLLVGTSSDSGGALLQINGNRIRVGTAKTPASASDTGTAGEICWDSSYIYVCTATDTWKRAALSTW